MRKSIIIRNKVIPIWLLGIIIASILIAAAAGAYVYQLTIPGTVIIEGANPDANYHVEAYEDSACTQPLTNIDFGTMRVGELKYVTIYLKNTGNGTISKVNSKTAVAGWIENIPYHESVDFKPGDVIDYDVPIIVPDDTTDGSYSVTVTLDFVA